MGLCQPVAVLVVCPAIIAIPTRGTRRANEPIDNIVAECLRVGGIHGIRDQLHIVSEVIASVVAVEAPGSLAVTLDTYPAASRKYVTNVPSG